MTRAKMEIRWHHYQATKCNRSNLKLWQTAVCFQQFPVSYHLQSVRSKADCLLKKKEDNFLIFQKRWSKRLSSLICKSRIVICCSGAKVNYLVWYSMQVFLLEISTWFNSKNKYWMNKYLFCTSKHSWLGNKCLMLKTQNPFWCPPVFNHTEFFFCPVQFFCYSIRSKQTVNANSVLPVYPSSIPQKHLI